MIFAGVASFFVYGTLFEPGFWLSADQAGQVRMNAGQYEDAADTFVDPMRRGTALYKAGNFKLAAQAFARIDSPEASYNLGNCLLLQGKYAEAVEQFDAALRDRPAWEDARINRDLAAARAEMLTMKGGDMGDQKLGADEIRFDRSDPSEGQETEVAAAQPLDDASMQAMWLRRVQTRPADFLKSKFAWQQFQSKQDSSASENASQQ